MPFIGAQPATTFAKATSQVFTNANGNIVDFTLNKHVSNPEDIEVFVANIQQQPTTSYTILSDGVTLRFSEAPPSGDFYVVYRNLAQQTGTDTGAFRKTGGSISDAVFVTGNDSSYTQASGNATSTLSVINSSHTNSGNGVLYVKQGAATNQPTMTLEQTGGGGNPNDTQGLHIKIAGQNQGSGKAIRVTTTNSSLNSGNAFDAFTVYNGGDVSVHGNIAMGTAGKGIDFSATTDGYDANGSELLADYERGAYNLTFNGFSQQTVSQGSYVRVGHLCFVTMMLHALGSQNSNQFTCTLPFTSQGFSASNNTGYYSSTTSQIMHHNVDTGTVGLASFVVQGTNTFKIYKINEDGAWGAINNNAFSSEDQAFVSITYIVA